MRLSVLLFLCFFPKLLFSQDAIPENNSVCSELNWFMDKLENDNQAIKGKKVYESYDLNNPSYYYESKATFNDLEGRLFESPNPYKIKRLEFHGRYELIQQQAIDQMVKEILKNALACLGDDYTQSKLVGDNPINELVSHVSELELSEDSKKFHVSAKTEIFNDEYFLVLSFYQPYVKKD